jgi:SAM-dependent methyltransferase
MVSREEQVRREAELAQRLQEAAPAERGALYGEVYDRIYEMHLDRAPDVLDFGARPAMVRFLEKLSAPGDDVVEVGCGAGMLAVELARRGRAVTGIEVSKVILDKARERAEGLEGIRFLGTSGMEIPVEDAGADLVYSVEVLEHLHPEDVRRHLAEVHRVLRPGGRYWLLTPNPVESVAAGDRFGVEVDDAGGDVHLKEWTYRELNAELRAQGFRGLRSPWRNERLFAMPLLPASWFGVAESLPARGLRVRAVRSAAGIIATSIVATKPAG